MALLATVLGVAFLLRVFGLDWDQGHLFHPDERAILMKVFELGLPWPPDLALLLDPARSPLNPRWFPYGSFPLYLLKLAGSLAALVDPAWAQLEHLRLVGRALSALLDTATVLLVYLIGSRLYRPAVGLLAAGLAAVTVLHIQLSHFYAVDVLVTFCVMLTLYGGALLLRSGPSSSGLALMSLGLGLGLATKVSIAPLALAVVAAHALWACQDDDGRVALSNLGRVRPIGAAMWNLAKVSAVAALVFLAAEPYAFLDRATFLRDTREQSEMVLRVRDYPYTRQYVDTPAYLYPMWQLSVWGLGIPLALASWAGLLAALRRGLWEGRAAELLLLSWLVPYFLLTGAFPVKFLRYLLPVVPVLLIFAARLLLDWRARTLAVGSTMPTVGLPSAPTTPLPLLPIISSATIVLVLAATAVYALAHVQIYARPHPAVAASLWIKEQVPPGTTLLREHWDEGLPGLNAYPQRDLTLYEPDDARKLSHLVGELQRGEYLVIYSNRLYGTIPRLPERYPLSSRYYEALFRGELGYALAYAAASYPSFGGISLVDDTFSRPGLPAPELLRAFQPAAFLVNLGYAEESITAYDHPLVLIFRKTASRTPAQLAAALSPPAPPVTPAPEGSRLLLSNADRMAQQAGGTWRDMFNPDSLANQFPFAVWLLAVQILGLVALPITLLLFQSLPDRGYAFARPLGLLLVSYLAWLGASLKLLPYTWASIVFAAVAVGLASGALARAYGAGLTAVVRERWRLLALEEALFLVAFTAWYGLRLLNPDLWHPWRGGEKPMDFAYLNAVIKSTWMPPYDPWLAGGYINYYYFGQVLVATVTKLTGIVPEVAYNLAVPLFFAFLASGVFSVVYNLAEGARRALEVTTLAALKGGLATGIAGPALQGGRIGPPALSSLGPVLAAGAGILMVAVLGNLDGLAQLFEGLGRAAGWKLASDLPGVSDLSAVVVGAAKVLTGAAALPEFDYWRSSRMMPPTSSITEFPFFTFLFADLHAHLLGLPYTVLVLALALNVASSVRRQWWGGLPSLIVLGWVLGALRWINSWDLPTYLLVAAAAILIRERSSRVHLGYGLFLATGLNVGLVYVVSAVVWLPFSQSYELFYAGVVPSPETTTPGQYLLIHGLAAWVVGGFLVVEALAVLGGASLLRGLRLGARYWFHLSHVRSLLPRLSARRALGPGGTAVTLAGSLAVALMLALMGQPLAGALLMPLAVAGLLVFRELGKRHPAGPQMLFVLALVVLALSIGIGVEFVTLQGDIDRMNTVFKFYLQAWVLYGIAAAFALWWLLSGCWQRTAAGAPAPERRSLASLVRPWRTPFVAGLILLATASALYPLAATPVRLRDRILALPPTPDGLAYLREAVIADARGPLTLRWDDEAIRWLRANVNGSPVVLEGVTPIYRWGGRVSIISGLPTVIGWDWHQRQQRWAYQSMIDERLQDVKTLYTVEQTAGTLDTLRKYGVQYVYVGELERQYYPAVGLAKFGALVGHGLSVVYQNPVVTIFRVDVGAG